MKKVSIIAAIVAAFGVSALPSVASAANAKHPYRHVNKMNDRGNNTGDSATAKLNQQQLDKAKSGQ